MIGKKFNPKQIYLALAAPVSAAIAIAITFRAGLFNIGVEGQLRLAALFSMYLGAKLALPPVLHVLAIFLIAMTVGGLWRQSRDS